MRVAEVEDVSRLPRRGPLRDGNGAQGRNRTTDTVIFSHVLYQLSYLGIRGIAAKEKRV